MLLSLFGVFSLLVVLGIVAFLVTKRWSLFQQSREYQYRHREERTGSSTTKPEQDNFSIEKKSFRRLALIMLPVVVFLFAVSTICFSGAYIKPTECGVVENTYTGHMSVLSPGIHFWPKDKDLIPFASKVVKYDLKQLEIKVGTGEVATKETGIETRSTSPGNPKIYYIVRSLYQIVPEQVLTIHRQYGTNYKELWVEKSFLSAIKTVQGALEYSAVYNREDMQTKIKEKFGSIMYYDGKQAIKIVQVDVVDYGFEDELDRLLTQIKNKEFDRANAEKDNATALARKTGELEVAKKQQEINVSQQTADQTAADTAKYIAISLATSDAEKVRLAGKAEADASKAKALAQAEGITKIQEALSLNSEGYLKFTLYSKWQGNVPNYVGNLASIPLIDITQGVTGLEK